MTDMAQRELVVKVRGEVALRASAASIRSSANHDVSGLTAALAAAGATMRPLFGVSEQRLEREALSLAASTPRELPSLSTYYRVDAPDAALDALAAKLRDLPEVEASYVKPRLEPALRIKSVPPSASPAAPPATPSFRAQQGYLEAAPGGVDAVYAWGARGGRGAGVRVIDIEGAWRMTHEDLLQNQHGVVGGTATDDLHWRNHGTAVIGVIGGDDNGQGVVGIAPDADTRAVSIFGGLGIAAAIRHAATLLAAGDIILIELHTAGPRFNFQERDDQDGYIAVEWWPDVYDAIRFAVARGVIVVEAAGNGSEDLDDPIYDTPAPGFPSSWRNPFRRREADSGAVLVGAGAPPSGSFGPDRSRLDFSNYGAAIDAQGWGYAVTTCGYGDLQHGDDEDRWYTAQFSGTSSASPIVVGSLACLQGNARALRVADITPARARQLLRETGSLQQDAPGRPATQRIGNRPDLRALLARLPQPPSVKALIAANNQDGRLEVFATALDGALWHLWQSHPSAGPWSSIGNLGGVIKQAVVSRNQDGRLEVLALGSDDALFNLYQTAPNAGWSGWNRLGGTMRQIAVERNADGRLEVFGIGSDGALYNNYQTHPSAGPWSGWGRLGGTGLKRIATALNADGRLEVFGIGGDDAVWNIYQTHPSAGPWSGWGRIGGSVKDITAIRNADGRLEVFAIGRDDALHHVWQTAASAGPWSGWASEGGNVKRISAALNADGRLEVFGIGSDGSLQNIYQTAPSTGPWSGWNRLGGFVKRIQAARNQDGRLEVFGIGGDDRLYNIWQTRPSSGPWSGWSPLT